MCMLIDSLAKLGEGTFTPTKTLARQWKWNYLLCLGLVRQLHRIDCQKIFQVQILYIHSFRVRSCSRSFQNSERSFIRSFPYIYIYTYLYLYINIYSYRVQFAKTYGHMAICEWLEHCNRLHNVCGSILTENFIGSYTQTAILHRTSAKFTVYLRVWAEHETHSTLFFCWPQTFCWRWRYCCCRFCCCLPLIQMLLNWNACGWLFFLIFIIALFI